MRTYRFILCGCLFASALFFASCTNTSDSNRSGGTPLFTLLDPEQTHVTFENTLTEGLNTNILMYEYFYNGGGIAAADFNNDGLVDLYFTSNMSENKFYLNRGNMTFEDITATSRAGGRSGPWKTGVNAVDINGDGRMDLYLCYSGALPPEKRANQLFINMGNDEQGIPRFAEQAGTWGLASTGYSNQSYFLDVDKDGDLDMLLLNHNPKNLPLLNEEGTKQLLGKDDPEKGLRLFKQSGGKFTDVTTESGINGSELSYGLGLGISDFNEDGWPDFYVSNDYSVPDYLYINNRNGTFTNQLPASIGHNSQFSMGNDVADINNDGWQDIYTLDMLPEDNRRQKLLLAPDNYARFDLNVRSGFYYQYMRNMLQVNNGNGTFSETGQIAGISNTDWSWAPLLADYDNDGWKDLYITNGYFRDYTNLDFINYMNNFVEQKGRLVREDVMDLIREMPSSNVVNYVFHNNGDGSFSNRTVDWGMNRPSNSNGAVYADLDNDGDLDLVVNNINQPAFIYRNEAQKDKKHFLDIRLQGAGGNTSGLGALVRIYYGARQQMLEQNPTRGYLSSVTTQLHFGLDTISSIDSLTVTWSNGKAQRLYGVAANKVLTLAEKDATENTTVPGTTPSLFTQVNAPVPFAHTGASTNDFNRQPLLICALSYNGPCMTKADLDGDGQEDLLVGGAAGQSTGVFLGQKNGTFLPITIPALEADKACDDASIAVFDANGDGLPDICIASGGYNTWNENDPLFHDRLYLNQGHNQFARSTTFPATGTGKSVVRAHDINGDGFPDLFIGGRSVPGRYPEPPRSYLFINDGKGNYSDQTEKICPELLKPGMITDAVWTDLDLDGSSELVVIGEWMPVTVYQLREGKLVNATGQFLDGSYSGWWNTITVADVNEDKYPDLIVGNFGLNTQFHASDKEPMEMYYADFDGNGSVDPLFSFYIQHKRYPYITRDELVAQVPVLKKRFSDYKSYADITMDDLYSGKELADAGHLTANRMETTCFISSPGKKFGVANLPKEAQYAPVYSIMAADVDRDGHQDLLLFGNNSHTKIRLGKFDANYGTLLKGDGKGDFQYIGQRESGLRVRGDVRSCTRIGATIYLGINGQPVVAYRLNEPGK